MLCLSFLFVLLSLYEAATPGYCTRAKGIFNTSDGGSACFQDNIAYSLTNCCFRCVRSTGDTQCGSFYNYGVTSCTGNSTATARAIADCNGSSYQCTCFSGIDMTELNSNATASPTLSPVSSPAPTNGASSSPFSMIIVFVAFILSFSS